MSTLWEVHVVDEDEEMRETEYLICKKPEDGKAMYRSVTHKADLVPETDFVFVVRGILRSMMG